MNIALSIYLDAVRFAAAMTVFLGHVSGTRFTGGFLWQIGAYQGAAVALFFVLSGFVIGYVQERRETDARTYTIARMARIFSVSLPAIALTMLLDPIGRAVSPALYSDAWGYTAQDTWLQVIAALTFTQKIFGADLSLGSDLPYWSLNYEVLYYIMFGIGIFVRPLPAKLACLAVAALIAGLPVLAMFPLWLAGYSTIVLKPWSRLGRQSGWLLIAGSIAAAVLYEAWSWNTGRPLAALGPAWRPELPQDYVVAAVFLANLVGIASVSSDLERLATRIAKPVRWFASQTFSLYLYHLPIAQFLAAINPWPPSSALSRGMVIGGTLLAVCMLAHLTERRKQWFHHLLAALFRPPASRAASSGG